MQFEEVIGIVFCEVMFYVLCIYFYDVVLVFMLFYEVCLMLKDGIELVVCDSCLVLLVLVVKMLE